uniref:Putative type I restriction-modification system, S subunit. [hsdS] n=1 Tax=Magnetococcus massalia (strain MO-1) TaxID=451514 RepID=A0A1S7LNM9_MAGMO|nr:Putative type I restriction-modification system, S subunit [hsdS] [Candidatus Magnetococcus massalia]
MGWETAKLGDVCELIKRGVAPKYIDEGGICVINQKCIRDHAINLDLSRRHNDNAKQVNPERYIRTGDVLVNSTGTGTLGRVAQIRSEPKEPTTVDTHVTIVRPKPGLFHQIFFGYMLIQIEDEITSSGAGTSGQTELSRTVLETKFDVAYPRSITEQRRIVAILDEAFAAIDAAIANTQRNLQNARELFESHLNTIFSQKGDGWVEKRLGDLIDIKHGFAFKSDFFSESGDFVLLTPGNFYEHGGYRDRGKKQKFYVGEIPDGFILTRGDFLIAMTEQAPGLLGSSIIAPENERFLHNQRLGLAQSKPGTVWCNEFFFHQFNTQIFREAVSREASGVKVRHTSPKKLQAIQVAFPATEAEQKHVADQLNQLKKQTELLELNYQRKLDALHELKQSILQKAFSGQLTTQETAA